MIEKQKKDRFGIGKSPTECDEMSLTEIVVPFAIPGRVIRHNGQRWKCNAIDFDSYPNDAEIFVTSRWIRVGKDYSKERLAAK